MGNLTYVDARKIASEFINSSFQAIDDELVIIDEGTIEKDYGWYFVSNSRKYMNSGDFRDQILGNGPVLVTKKAGGVVQFGTAFTIEQYISMYESGTFVEGEH